MDGSYQQKIPRQSSPCKTFCGLLIGSSVSIDVTWISTKVNQHADKISRLKKAANAYNNTSPSTPTFDYSTLQQDHPKLKVYTFFNQSQLLTSFLCKAMLSQNVQTETKYFNWNHKI
jgi:hypothetical protein